MAILNIRNLPDEVHRKLRLRAAMMGRSMEAEARQIIAQAVAEVPEVSSPAALQEWVDGLYGKGKPSQVVSEFLAERRREAAAE